MPTIRLSLPRPHDAQAKIFRERKRFNVEDCGRRFGKTMMDINEAAPTMLDGKPVAVFFPNYRMLSEVWRNFVHVFEPVTKDKSEVEHRLELITGGVVEMWSLETESARGRKYARAIIDEAALVPNLMTKWSSVIRPMLVDYQGDAFIKSTPKGRNGFWRMWSWGQDPANKEWKSWKFATHDNPYIPPAEVMAMRETMPERIFLQEIMAEFIEDAGGVFRRVAEAATAAEQEKPLEGHDYIIGVDWGKSADFTVLTVLDLTIKSVIALDRFNQIDYTLQVSRLRVLCDRFHPLLVKAESNSMGEPLIEQLQRSGLPVQPFNTNNASKTLAIDALALAFERGDIKILPDPILIDELQAYEMERLPSGSMRYSAPEGMHDDCVMSLAIAWSAIEQQIVVTDNPFW
jgi:hypothetical protein